MLSVVSYPDRGKSSYRGDCSPKLIHDLIDQFDLRNRDRTHQFWKEKVRQTLQINSCFRSDARGIWAYAAA